MTDVRQLDRELQETRESVIGLTFAEAPEAFKDIESLKVRILVAKNPNHFEEKYEAVKQGRAKRRVH
jgi:hypothetical protein